ncbi:ribonuclease [Nocardia sp. CDC159]|uniref:Ribonuclease n=1 Tax=Nocardia pulmonis TaxID=2951408 RepID=A0A9X2J1D6_9NOCA|nr:MULTISPECIES: ribonuclease domain-containing protein [Nocardia]MCM6778000.1 ribonuclease [Nocardia pulmonis]MCM6790829.1 ribonuclease [Nocardia sp. CDC159]
MNLSGKRFRGLLALAGLAIVLVVAFLASRGTSTDTSAPAVTSTKAAPTSTVAPTRTGAPAAAEPGRARGVPDRAYDTLREIDAGRWPDSANAPGTKGGEEWMNRGGALPRSDASGNRITYQEWDVNPKRRGQTRDAERIVTGSDGSAYYTGDHYQSFTRMR